MIVIDEAATTGDQTIIADGDPLANVELAVAPQKNTIPNENVRPRLLRSIEFKHNPRFDTAIISETQLMRPIQFQAP